MNIRKLVGAVLLFGLAMTIAASAQTLTTLAFFNSSDTGASVPLIQGMDGNLYGTTPSSGPNGGGTVYQLSRHGGLTTLHRFSAGCRFTVCPNGYSPAASLVQYPNGNLYGSTVYGGTNCQTPGCGTLFQITPGRAFASIFHFCLCGPDGLEGVGPMAPMVLGRNGNLYGTTRWGGYDSDPLCGYQTDLGCGTVFEIGLKGFRQLYAFCPQTGCTDGAFPYGGLVQATDGDLYGVTGSGGANSKGSVFKITPRGNLTTVYSFCSEVNCTDGLGPASLLQATDGNFYGMTVAGGVGENCSSEGDGCGTIFKLTPGGNLTTLYSFCSLPNCPDGLPGSNGIDAQGASIIQGTDGNLYGTTGAGGAIQNAYCASDVFFLGCGTIFEISLAGQFSTLYTFCAQETCSDGATPGGLLQSTNGKFYGVTISGGVTNANCYTGGCGTVFSLDTGLGPFVAFVQPFGKIGETTQILGQGFEGTTQVSFNGIPANFMVRADTSLAAVVPIGATTGSVIVTTPTGVRKSNVPFLVVP